jgi:hypothetical protein
MNKPVHIKAPDQFTHKNKFMSVFLGGTIDNGSSVNWQEEAADFLLKHDLNVLNPRRDDWNPEWEQTIENPEFYRQVKWEMNAMEFADIVILNFLKGSVSPITLLELGLMVKNNPQKLYVAADYDYWRRGNIEVICEEFSIPLYPNLEHFYDFLEIL